MNIWHVSENTFDPTPKHLHSQESVFTIGNGYLCTRGTFEEGYPGANPATLLYGIFDSLPVGKEELANAPDWLPITLFVNGERFRLDKGHVLSYQRTLDMQHGVLRREVRWESISGNRLLIASERFVSLADEHIGAIRYSVTAEQAKGDLNIVLLAEFNTAVGNYDLMHWMTDDQGHKDSISWLKSVTRKTGVQLAQTMSFATTTGDFQTEILDSDVAPSIRLYGTLTPGATIAAEKFVVVYTSRDGVEPLAAALGRHHEMMDSVHSYDTLLTKHQEAWRLFWQMSDIIIEGDEEAQIGVRYNIYQLRINASSHDDRYSIAAKGLTGFGYRGHIYHDTEIFMLPFFMYVHPSMARNLLLYRYHLLPAAREKAAHNGYEGAQYPWESTLDGQEATPDTIIHPETGKFIPVLHGRIELHITASIAYRVWQYWYITGDDEFMRDYGAEMLLSTAAFWGSRAEYHPEQQNYQINDVIGPDEWHEHVNNNTYTNSMAQWNIQIAIRMLDWLHTKAPEKAEELTQKLDLTNVRLNHWHDVATNLRIPQDKHTGVFEEFDGFFQLQPLDQDKYKQGRTTSYQGLLGVEEVQKYRTVKQADVLMLLTVREQDFDLQTKRANWDYYYPITDHDYGSSLTPALHVILACELGKANEAYKLFMLGNLVDLENLRGNTPEGIHAACCGAVWQAIAFGFAGLSIAPEGYTTTPHLPDKWMRLAFSFMYKGKLEYIDLRK